MQRPEWFKTKGYLHITPSINSHNWKQYVNRIKDPSYIEDYAFYPLMHRNIVNRRYKKGDIIKHKTTQRAHSHKNIETRKTDRHTKVRPIHYATHLDSLIYSYYAKILNDEYESKLSINQKLDEAVTAYRKVKISDKNKRGKSNIHFAKDVFDEITNRVQEDGSTAVITLDLKSFFSSISHDILYKAWANLLKVKQLPNDHNNVFHSCTNFSYILLDDLRNKRHGSFNEAKLARIRKKYGYKSFFENNQDFRDTIKNGELPIYKNPFRSKGGEKELIGIPQGLPISSVLANLYLLDFDKNIVDKLVEKKNVFYRRYSDDIIICCSQNNIEYIKKFLSLLVKEYKIDFNSDKTDIFLFKELIYNKDKDTRITSIKLTDSICTIDHPLTYLGFEFRGYKTVIKSENLSKYYRRLIQTIKTRARRAKNLSQQDPTVPKAVFINQVKKLYNAPLKYDNKTEVNQVYRKRHDLIINERGEFEFDFKESRGRRTNFISYINKCDKIFETKDFSELLKKREQIIGQAINKHLK